MAVQPAAALTSDKQRRLCLTDDHGECATYQAAAGRGAVGAAGRPRPHDRRARSAARPLVRTAPMVLDHGRLTIAMPAFRSERGFGQGALVILMAVAFAAIIVARLSSAGGDASGPGGQAAAALTAGASASPRAVPVASEALPEATPGRTLVPTENEATPKPGSTARAAATSYTVKRGDTLTGIAARFGTTVGVLKELNSIKDAAKIRIGQVLDLP
ncbi:MAG TPA: LysM domain-containing protein [Candidatus Saccharimonadales bacterium]|nr:LysM domain-containing protein [Candidatus Saccharimonadales bacterium]